MEQEKGPEAEPEQASVPVENEATEDESVEDESVQVEVSNEESQRWLDLQAINAHMVAMRKNLSAAKLNRVLSNAGLLSSKDTKHDRQWRKDIAEMRKAIDLLKDLKETISSTGIEEPTLVGLEVATDAEVHALADA